MLKLKTQNQNSKLKVFRFALCIIVLHFALCALNLNEAKAQSASRSFTISPPSVKFSLNPGEKAEKSFKITNNTGETLVFYANVQNFIVTDSLGTPELLPADLEIDNKYAASNWTAVIPDKFTVLPGKSASTTLYLQIPGDAGPGGRYISVAFKPVSEGLTDATGASVNTVAGSLVYLTVNGDISENGRVTAFSAPAFSEHGPIKFTAEIKNTGDIHINPKAQIIVKNLFGKKVWTSALSSSVNVFPGTSRLYENSWEKKWLLGRYQAKLEGYFGKDNNLQLAAGTAFWVIPYKFILAVIAVAVTAYILYKKTSAKREIEETPEETNPRESATKSV